MALPVDRAQSHAMNLQVLKRQDESVVDIVDMASHVVVYEFDQAQQSWKRKEVEGCLFIVKRYTSPRFQIFVNNRLSTTNMTIQVNSNLEVDSVDTFLILRSPDAAAVGGYAIYGLWFFPEDDREKILKLLQRMVQTVKEPNAPPTPTKPVKEEPVQASQPPRTQTPTAEQQQQQPQQPKQQRQPRQKQQQQQQQTGQAPRSGGRGRNKRDSSTGENSKPATPTAILQRPAKTESASETPAVAPSNAGYTPISREEGIAAGNAILGMLGGYSQAQPVAASAPGPVLAAPSYASTAPAPVPAQQPAPRSRSSSSQNGSTNAVGNNISKEQLKQTLISLLDEPQFFDQIYHAYVNRVHPRA